MITNPEDWRPREIDDLEPGAWGALRAGTAAVIAGPGAGKTEFLAQRAAYLLETGICRHPRRILAISFKRDAASNLRRRVESRLANGTVRFDSMTFDAFTKSILDRFKTLLPVRWSMQDTYRIGYSSQADIDAFLGGVAESAPQDFQDGITGIGRTGFLNNLVGTYALPSEPAAPKTAEEYAIQSWWSQNYQSSAKPALDFVMINRLAELIVRSSPQLRRALIATYPFVFVDEFQDTTYAQYSFLDSVFGSGQTVVTVVGDRKQRIMGWAGALADAFEQFEDDFGADQFELSWNFRSSQELVDLQERFAKRLDPAGYRQVSKVAARAGASPTQIWSFSTARLEAETIAAWVAEQVTERGRPSSDFALIARQRVDALEPELARAFAAQGMRVRNDDVRVGSLRLQDLLKDDLVRLFIGLVRLAASRGHPQTWREVTSMLGRLSSADSEREVGSGVDDSLSEFLAELRAWFAATPLIEHNTPPSRRQAVDGLTGLLASFVRVNEVAQKRTFGDRPEDVQMTVEAFKARLIDVLGDGVESWDDVPGAFVDENAVSLLTIHRSKGLEYRTVFFIGLDGDQWWAHARDTVESTMTFFVGVSRAAENLIFTQCDQRGSTAPIADLYRTLGDAGVELLRLG